MNYFKLFVIAVSMITLLCGCQHSDILMDDNHKQEGIESTHYNITVGKRSFSIEEINAEIMNTFNNVLYYHGDDDANDYLTSNQNVILHKNIEYELYFDPVGYVNASPIIYMVITNIQHPLSTAEKPLLYQFGVIVTEWGLQSDFYIQAHTSSDDAREFSNKNVIELGSYTMRIDEIVKPQYETHASEWLSKSKKEIQLYMDKNTDKILVPGHYYVYVQNFFKSDKDSIIIFEHENGDIYTGFYYSVHDVSGENPAALNKVRLVEDSTTEPFKSYMGKVKSDPAVSVEYEVK